MRINGSAFKWERPVGGFAWSTETETDDYSQPRDKSNPVLVPQTQDVRTYEPFREHTGLFRQFAETRPTREGVLQFANRYGRLSALDPVMMNRVIPPWLDQLTARA